MWCLIDSSDQQGKEIEDLRSNSTEMPSSQAFGFPRACQVGGCTARLWNPHWGSLPTRSSFKIIVKKCPSLLSVTFIMTFEGWFHFHLDVCKCQNTLQSGQHSCIWWHARDVECFYLIAALSKSSSKTEPGCFTCWRIWKVESRCGRVLRTLKTSCLCNVEKMLPHRAKFCMYLCHRSARWS